MISNDFSTISNDFLRIPWDFLLAVLEVPVGFLRLGIHEGKTMKRRLLALADAGCQAG